MPRLNLPQNQVRSAGSTGVQPDINTRSPQFAAINRLAGAVEGYADEKRNAGIRLQNHVDNGAMQFYKRNSSEFEMALDGKMQQNRDHSVQNDLINQEFKAYRETLRDELNRRGVSDSTRAQAFESLDHFEKNYRTKTENRQIGENIELANLDIQKNAQALIESGNIDLAEKAIGQMEGISEVQRRESFRSAKNEASKNLYGSFALALQQPNVSVEDVDVIIDQIHDHKGITDSHKKTLLIQANGKRKSVLSSDESFIVDDALFQIQVSGSMTELDAIDIQETVTGDPLSKRAQTRIDRAISIQKRAISAQAYRDSSAAFKAAEQGSLDAINGLLVDRETAISRGIDPEYYDSVLQPIVDGMSGASGVMSDEFNAAKKKMNDFVGSATGFWGDDMEPTQRGDLMKSIGSESLNFDARIQLAAYMSRAMKADAADFVLGTAVGDYELNEDQKKALETVQSVIFDKIRGQNKFREEQGAKDIARFTFAESLLDPEQAVWLFDEVSSPSTLDQMKGDNPKTYEEVMQPLIDEAVKKSIQTQMREELAILKPTR